MINNYYIVAINLVVDGKLENKDNFPILCYCASEDDVIDVIKENVDFRTLIHEKCITTFLIDKSYLSYVFYKEIDGEDSYTAKTVKVSDIFSIDYDEYIKLSGLPKVNEIFEDLYNKSFKTNFGSVDTVPENCINNVKEIYSLLKEKYQDKLSKQTVINYVRKELRNTVMKESDIDKLIELVENILQNLE